MTKQEFLEKLRISLNGKISSNRVEEHVRFYEDYMNVEIRKGKSEEEVLAALGDPRLIARTIVETDTRSGQASENVGGTNGQYGGTEDCREYQQDGQVQKRSLARVPAWAWLILGVLVVVLVLSAVFSVISALLPVLLPILLVLLLVKIFRNE